MRTPDSLELIKANPFAYILAAVIAHRGRYHDGFNQHNLALGEALLGDFKNCGMTRQQYRTAKHQLAEWHFATFRTTNKGTVGKLVDTRLFSIFRLPDNHPDNTRPTSSQPPANHQLTTNKEHKNNKNKKEQGENSDSPAISFQKPSLSEVIQFGESELNEEPLTCRKFFDYQEAIGWKVGNKPMVEWRAALSYWCLNEDDKDREAGRKSSNRNAGTYNAKVDQDYESKVR